MTKSDFKRIFMHSFRLYFAPLVGAFHGAFQAVRDENKRYTREHA